VFGKLFDFSRDWLFIVLTVLIMKMFDMFQINFLCIIANWATEILRLLAQIKKQ
jgi:hypothetical protein